MAGIEFLDTKSPVHKLDPRVKIIAFLLFSIFIFTTKSFIVISLIFFPVVSLWFIAKIPFSRIAGLIKLMIGLMAMITAMQALFQDGTTILVQPIIPNFIPLIGGVGTIYWEGVEYGLVLSYRLITLILIMPLFLMTTDVNSMSVGLVKLGLPYKFAYMASTALNMIPSLTEQVNTIMDAQKLRGKTMLLFREDIDPEVIFAAELIGVEVFEDGVKIGEITEVLDYPGNSVYVVKGEKSYMIPAVKAFILNTDVDGNRMDVKLLEGMEIDAG